MDPYAELIPVPGAARFPIELRPPHGFHAADPATWPRVQGRLEYVHGRLLYMPPCGDVQQGVAASVATILGVWQAAHPDYFVGTNEAGMMLGGEIRGADAAVWRRSELGELTGGYVRVPPILAVEIAGRDEDEPELREKAAWYLSVGVACVWLVLPKTRDVVLLTAGSDRRLGGGDRLTSPGLPDLEAEVERLFAQV